MLSDLAVGLQSGLNVSQLCCADWGEGRKGKSDSLGDEAMLLKDQLHMVPSWAEGGLQSEAPRLPGPGCVLHNSRGRCSHGSLEVHPWTEHRTALLRRTGVSGPAFHIPHVLFRRTVL